MSDTPRVVFDTVVFVRSLINPRGRWGQLVFRHYARYRLVISPAIALEILDVLRRPAIARKFRALETLDVPRVIDLLSQAEVVEVESIPAVSRDPNDDKFLATAVAGSASFLVTEDQDLLVLQEHEDVRIVDALTFLRVLEEHPDELVDGGRAG